MLKQHHTLRNFFKRGKGSDFLNHIKNNFNKYLILKITFNKTKVFDLNYLTTNYRKISKILLKFIVIPQ